MIKSNSLVKTIKVEKILTGSLDSIPSPSPSVKIQIMGGKVCLRFKGKTLLSIVNKLLKTKSLLTSPNNVLPYLKFGFSEKATKFVKDCVNFCVLLKQSEL